MTAADDNAAGASQPAGDAPAVNREVPIPMSQEFFLRVNDFIQMANRIERRFDTHHAQMVFLHAFSRYSGHHYRTTTSVDDTANREAFANYIADAVRQLIGGHLRDMAGEPGPASDVAGPAGDAASDQPTPEA